MLFSLQGSIGTAFLAGSGTGTGIGKSAGTGNKTGTGIGKSAGTGNKTGTGIGKSAGTGNKTGTGIGKSAGTGNKTGTGIGKSAGTRNKTGPGLEKVPGPGITHYFCFDPKLRESSFNLGARVGNFIIMRPRARANLRANTNRGNVHCKQNCFFRGVLLFQTIFAEFCVKSGRKTEPWNWAVRPGLG